MPAVATIIFLRGVNVGGHRTFRPSILANQLSQFAAINIGAAGTLVARKQASQARLRSELTKRLPFNTEVMLCRSRDLLAAASQNPFDSQPPSSGLVRFVSVLAKVPRALPALPLQIPSEGKWLVRILSRHNRFLFGCYRREMKAIGHLGSIDKLFGVPGTIRNWNTIGQILKILEEA